jgi:hypothetical protein
VKELLRNFERFSAAQKQIIGCVVGYARNCPPTWDR